MKKSSLATLVVIIILAIAGGGLIFYWFEYRPTQIRKECSAKADDEAKASYEWQGSFLPLPKEGEVLHLALYRKEGDRVTVETKEENWEKIYNKCLADHGLAR